MVYRVAVDSVGSGIRYDLGLNDNIIVPTNVSVISTDNAAIASTGSFRSVRLFGLVASGDSAPAISMGLNPASFAYAYIYVGATGVVDSEQDGITIDGGRSYIANYGQIFAQDQAVYINSTSTDPAGTIYNYGTITGLRGIECYAGATVKIYNYGKINGASYAILQLSTGSGRAYVYNRGQIDGTVSIGGGNDTLLNRGIIIGDVNLFSGNDLLDNRNGTIEGTIAMGGGADTFRPGASEETADGGGEAGDTLDFSKSSGVKFALDGSMEGTGWAAGDTFSGFTDLIGSNLGADTLIGNSSNNTIIGGGGNDIISGFAGGDVLFGGNGNDTIDGGAEGDALYGGAGNDTLTGGDSASDFLSGEAGNDKLIGGGGADIVAGGAGADTFIYRATGDFGGTALGSREQVNGFSSAERDKIDLSALDASTRISGNQAFTFIGSTAFSNVARQLRFEASSSFITVYGDLNGDSVADIAFDLNGITSVVAADFIL